MSGIYIHIPFCKQACHYCDFHFSTSLKKKDEMLEALKRELVMRKNEVGEKIQTVYFGGGTPSILSHTEINALLDAVHENYEVCEKPEITLEANPDDLSEKALENLYKSKINRLSIGIQSFFDEDLKLMNRAHNATEAVKCLEKAIPLFKNISIDLIYGIPGMSEERWVMNIRKALHMQIPHISAYALTVEPNTALKHFIDKKVIDPVNDEEAHIHFTLLCKLLEEEGFVHYELSNFGKKDYFSRNNTAYWQGKKYIGIGPSAHSFNGEMRSWNIANNAIYIKNIQAGTLPRETEKLSVTDRYNEYIMTRLRTMWGVSLHEVTQRFGVVYKEYLMKQAQQHLDAALLVVEQGVLKTTPKGKFLSDGISSDLFLLNLGK
ncbi:radical SAM family heme chaperone HemW [Ascidiimonas aurantiaca]|uniref:radical SAM family heme chaperone HemW n=1 Tax=Ascidiimonas aurantiaca TaxID=1685432 RepID=UPI0030EF73C2